MKDYAEGLVHARNSMDKVTQAMAQKRWEDAMDIILKMQENLDQVYEYARMKHLEGSNG